MVYIFDKAKFFWFLIIDRQRFLILPRSNTMKNFLLLALIVATVSSCNKKCHHQNSDLCAEPEIGIGDCITDSNVLKTALLGKWNWTQASVWGRVENPCIKSLNYTYEFLTDGKVKVYLNGSYSATANYTFGHVWTSVISITDTTTASIHPEIYNTHGAVRLCGNYLIIDNSPVDGPKNTFLREN